MADRRGQGNSCCLIFNAMITACLCLSAGQRIAWYMNGETSYIVWRCCTWSCWNVCPYPVVTDGEWWTTRPLTQDMLPGPVVGEGGNATNPKHGDYEPGDGEADYWSIWVLLFCGTFGSLIVLCTACGPAMRKGGPPLATAVAMFVAFLLHLACCICVGIQFFSYQEDQEVYNRFAYDQYDHISTTLSYYLTTNKYYYSFGNCVVSAFVFCLFSCFYEGIFALCAVMAHHDMMEPSVTGVRKWDSKGWGEPSSGPSIEAGKV